jgi:hypothetical protein
MTKEDAIVLLCEHFSEGLVRTIVDALNQEWVGLTYEEMQEILLDPKFQLKPLIVHAVEAKLKQKNNTRVNDIK